MATPGGSRRWFEEVAPPRIALVGWPRSSAATALASRSPTMTWPYLTCHGMFGRVQRGGRPSHETLPERRMRVSGFGLGRARHGWERHAMVMDGDRRAAARVRLPIRGFWQPGLWPSVDEASCVRRLTSKSCCGFVGLKSNSVSLSLPHSSKRFAAFFSCLFKEMSDGPPDPPD